MAAFDAAASPAAALWAADAIKAIAYAVRTVTIVSVNKLSEEMLPELEGNWVMASAPVFSSLAVVGFIAKSTLPCSGITYWQ